MASTNPNIILLEINGTDTPSVHESPANAAVTPGDLLYELSTGKVAGLATGGAANLRMFALENPYAPDPTATAISQTYAENDYVRYIYAPRGALVYARLAASQTITKGDWLIASSTAGCLAKETVDGDTIANSLVGIADESVTTTGSVGRIRVRIT